MPSNFLQEKNHEKNVLKYVDIWQNVDQKVIKTLFVTCHMGHMASDITPDIIRMRVGEHGKNVHVSTCYGLRVKVF